MIVRYINVHLIIIIIIMRKHNIPCAMKPYKTLRNILVHPKDKEELKQTSECVYKVPCANCKKTYVGETGRKLVVRLQEHRTEVESKNKRIFTRSQRSGTSTEYNTSALTDRPCSTRKPCDKLGGGISDRQGTRQTYQMDQGGNPHPQGRTTSHELGEMMTSFF